MYGPTTWRPRDDGFGDPERPVRVHVHVALASILLTFFAPLVGWALVLLDRHAPRSTWKRRLVALAIVDTALMLSLGLTSALGLSVDESTQEPPRIGVEVDARSPPDGVVVERVLPNSPAAAASIQPGDRIVAVDGEPVKRADELTSRIEATRRGTDRHLTIDRHGQSIKTTVTPSAKSFESEQPSSLFEPVDTERGLARTTGRRFAIGAGLVELALLAVLAVAARHKHVTARPAFAVVAGLLALSVVSSLVLVAFKATLGISLGAFLVALFAGSTALLVIGLLAARVVARQPVQVGRKISTRKAIALGALYGVAGAGRIAVLIAILVATLKLPVHSAADAFGLDPSWGPIGVGLFLVATTVVAPLGEELLFRGVLLPWLARWMRPAIAVVTSAIVFAVGHVYYGVGALLIGYYGLVLGWARLRTGQLWASIALHALLNASTAAVLLVESARSS